jgi:hypothetical protein
MYNILFIGKASVFVTTCFVSPVEISQTMVPFVTLLVSLEPSQ